MTNRRAYIEKIQPFVDKPFIKVINGLRRSGTSTLLLLVKKFLEEREGAKVYVQVAYLLPPKKRLTASFHPCF